MTDELHERKGRPLRDDELFPNSAKQQQLVRQIQKAIEEQDDLSDEELALHIWRLIRRL